MPPPRDVKKSTNLSDDDKRVLANRYRVEKKLGSGNFGTAFLVTDLKENEELKVLKEVSIGDMQPDESIESVHEANLLSKLDNPHILKYFDSFLDGEYFCIVTEYCEGGDLDVRFKQLKKENKRLTEQQVLDWTVQLLTAVNYMHSRRVLHRDLKARNIFLKNENIKIGDFGISRILQGTMDMASTFTGTPYYMSPEVLKHEGYNSKSDVWSIGCLLYEMCTLQHAFEGQGLMGVMYKIVEGKVPELPNTYSKDLNNILKKIFRKDPSSRPSCLEILKEPYISNHIKNMIQRLEATKLDQLDTTIVVKNDRNEIAKALNSKVSLKDLQKQSLPTVVEALGQVAKAKTNIKATPLVPPNDVNKNNETYDDDEDIRSGVNQPVSSKPKTSQELTPAERMRLNKLKKADEEAAKLGQLAKENYEERLIRDSFRREATIHSSAVSRNPILTQKHVDYNYQINPSVKQPIFKPTTASISSSSSSMAQDSYYIRNRVPYEYQFEIKDDEDDEGTILQTVQNYSKPNTQNTVVIPRKVSAPIVSRFTESDLRPIKPLKSRIENAFDEDGIPLDPELTNEYYQKFDDFENDSSPERKPTASSFTNTNTASRNSLSKTVVPNRRKVAASAAVVRKPVSSAVNSSPRKVVAKNPFASKTFSGSQVRASVGTRSEYEDLIGYMQSALDDKLDVSETFGDDSRTSVFGANARNTKIQNLRAQAMRRLGAETFEKCYNYLREQRRGNYEKDENKIFEGLKQYTPNPSDCFLVDQLLFLEESS